MKDRQVRKAILNTAAIFLLIIGVMLYFYLKDPNKNYLYYQPNKEVDVVIARTDLSPGTLVKESDISVVTVINTKITDNKLYLSNIEGFIGKKVLYPLKSGQVLIEDYFLGEDKWYEGKHEFAIEIDIDNTVAGSIEIGDYVDINVKYLGEDAEDILDVKEFDNLDIIISKIQVDDMKDADGVSHKEFLSKHQEGEFKAKYALFTMTYKEIDMFLDAKDKGEIFLIKYDDPTAIPNKTTYTAIRSIESNCWEGVEEQEAIEDGDVIE